MMNTATRAWHGGAGSRALLVALLLVASLVPPWRAVQGAPAPGGTLTYATNREPDMLDVNVGSSRYDRWVTANIYDQLLTMDRSGKLHPWLAESWQVSSDGRVYTFKLRRGVEFHDGTPLNAAAVKANFDRIVNPQTKSTSAIGLMGEYDRSEVVDPYTLRVTFKRPHPGFPTNLADVTLGIQSPAAMERFGADYVRNPVGTGPFMFKEWVRRDRIVLVKNPKYNWGPAWARHTGPAYLDQVVIRIIPEDGSRVAALEAGQLDGIGRVPPQNAAVMRVDRRWTVVNSVLPGTGVILVVNGRRPPTDDLAMRRALQHVMNVDDAARIAYFSQWFPHRGAVLSSPNPMFLNTAKMYAPSTQRAEQLLDEGGWRRGPDGIRTKGGVRASLVYIGFPSFETTRTMEWMGATLRSIGVELTIREMETGAIHRARQRGEHNLAHLTFIFLDPGFLRTLFHSENSGGGWNFYHAKDAQIDQWLEQGETEPDPARRAKLYADVQRRMMEQSFVIPVVYQHQISAFKSAVVNPTMYPVLGEYPYFYDTSLRP
jgi:peptide/nickel transport system substrate-binding protein